jgi:putative aminopeptidase FrvX
VLTGAVSIPCRYVHTTSEMVDSGDLDGALKILKGIASERLQLPT